MIVHNAFNSPRKVGKSSHGGDGEIEQYRVFDKSILVSNMNVVAYDVIPPGASVAVHDHLAEEEFYFILEGRGMMTETGEEREVIAGDIILTQPGGSHGIRNHSDQPLRMVAVEVKVPEAAGSEPRA